MLLCLLRWTSAWNSTSLYLQPSSSASEPKPLWLQVLQELGRRTTLRTLDLSRCYLGFADISALAGCASLRTLDLTCTGVTDISALARSPRALALTITIQKGDTDPAALTLLLHTFRCTRFAVPVYLKKVLVRNLLSVLVQVQESPHSEPPRLPRGVGHLGPGGLRESPRAGPPRLPRVVTEDNASRVPFLSTLGCHGGIDLGSGRYHPKCKD